MADTDIDAVRRQKKAEYDKQYRLKRKLPLQQQASKDIHDRVLSSLKIEGIRLLLLNRGSMEPVTNSVGKNTLLIISRRQ
jgi:hypothetical protein